MTVSTISIGELAARTGMSVSALRFHEAKGLLVPHRTSGNQRRYLKSDIRRVSFILIAQGLGLTVGEIGAELSGLPHGRTPTQEDWAIISARLKDRLDQRIKTLTRTRNVLDGCIGCGCLSLKACHLFNRDDQAGRNGPGPRYAMGDLTMTEVEQEEDSRRDQQAVAETTPN